MRERADQLVEMRAIFDTRGTLFSLSRPVEKRFLLRASATIIILSAQ